jgi:hypothetical protein
MVEVPRRVEGPNVRADVAREPTLYCSARCKWSVIVSTPALPECPHTQRACGIARNLAISRRELQLLLSPERFVPNPVGLLALSLASGAWHGGPERASDLKEGPVSKVFISYRRELDADVAKEIRDRLEEHLGPDAVPRPRTSSSNASSARTLATGSRW